mmetsp:Transcript_21/g.56  ORF Transcript_21/g.56 Transcript_21/m.56 type:complete len:232 (+) Transcript_21:70-765(+)
MSATSPRTVSWRREADARMHGFEAKIFAIQKRVSKLERESKKRRASNQSESKSSIDDSSGSVQPLHEISQAINELRAANSTLRRKLSLVEDALSNATQPQAPASPSNRTKGCRHVCRNSCAALVGVIIMATVVLSVPAFTVGLLCHLGTSSCPSFHWKGYEFLEMALGGACAMITCASCIWCYEDPIRYIFGLGFYAFDVCTQMTIYPKTLPGDFVFDGYRDSWNYEPLPR